MATTRRALRHLTKVYNDDTVKALICFVCGEIHCTIPSPKPLEENDTHHVDRCIRYLNRRWFQDLEWTHPGSLLNNCSYELWEQRYMNGHYAEPGSDEHQRQVVKFGFG